MRSRWRVAKQQQIILTIIAGLLSICLSGFKSREKNGKCIYYTQRDNIRPYVIIIFFMWYINTTTHLLQV